MAAAQAVIRFRAGSCRPERMTPINREAIRPDVARVTEHFDLLLRAIMAIDAQRLHITENELHQIALVPLDMIDDASRFDLAALFAHPAQRLDLELMRSSRFPSLAVIPAV